MPSRRLSTAWRLLKSGDLKQFFTRTLKFFQQANLLTCPNYSQWRETWVELTQTEQLQMAKISQSLGSQPYFTLFIREDTTDPNSLLPTIESVISQIYPNWVLHILRNDSSSLEFEEKISSISDERVKFTDSCNISNETWVIELSHDMLLHEAALLVSAISIYENPEISIIYSDHEHLDTSGNFRDPHMKPGWNPDLLASMNYMGPFIVYRSELWKLHQSKGFEQHGFLLEVTKGLERSQIFHLPYVLASVKIHRHDSHLHPEVRRVNYNVPSPAPLVSILIPTRDQGQMLERCLKSIFDITDYKNFEIVLIDHETKEPKARKVINDFSDNVNFRIIGYSGLFNFAAMINRAAEIASGKILVLLNNDTEIIEANWLTELVSQVSRPEVGIVGSLLLFGDNTIQHAGVHPGFGGLMGHGHKHLPGDSSGYFNRLKTVHEVAAVTGACLAIEKVIWNEVGRLDEDHLAVAYNDIDLCLKVREKDLRVLFTPFSKLKHHESVSRGVDDDPARNPRLEKEISVMSKRWGNFLENDPAYSPNLSFDGGGFKLANYPRKLPIWKQ